MLFTISSATFAEEADPNKDFIKNYQAAQMAKMYQSNALTAKAFQNYQACLKTAGKDLAKIGGCSKYKTWKDHPNPPNQ